MRFILLCIQLLFCPNLVLADKDSISHGIAMHGNLKYDPKFSHFDYVNANAPKGGMLRLGAQGTFDSFNNFIVKGNPAAGLNFLYDRLMHSSSDEAFSQYGQLAEFITVPKDRTWVSFTLRAGAKWHDGEPVSVEDVIWTFNTLMKNGSPFYRFYYGNVQNVVKIGDRTVKFNFKKGENRELPLILGQLNVLPKHFWRSRDFGKTTLDPPIGSGPYKIKTFEPGRSITYERIKSWWGKDLPVNKGQYNFKNIQYDYYRDTTIALEAFKSGEFDYRAENSSKAWATSYNIPYVQNNLIIKREIQHNRSSGMQAFIFNTRRDLFKNRAVRKALSYAFDFEWTNQSLFYGQYSRTRSFFDNSELAATKLPSSEELALLEPFRDQLPVDVFVNEYNPPRTDKNTTLRANLKFAANILKSVGWKVIDGKLIKPKTKQVFEFEILLVTPLFERIALPFMQNLKKLGINVKIRTIDPSQYRRRVDTFDFDMIVGGIGQSLSPGNEQRSYWGSKSADLEGGRNIIGIKSPIVDQLIEKIIAAPTRKSLVFSVQALDRVLQWGHWVIPHWHAKYDRIAYWNKFGIPKITPMQGAQFITWWVDPKKDIRLKKLTR